MVNRRRPRTLWALMITLFSLTLAHTVSAQGSLEAIVDRTTIGADETLQLTLRYSGGRVSAQPNFDELRSQFDILSQGQSSTSSYDSSRGTLVSYTDWLLTLAPKSEGTLLIPSFKLGNVISDAVVITVTPPAQAPAGQLKDVFVETEVNKRSVYVQEELILSYRLYYAINVDGLDAQPLELDNAVKESLPDARYRRRVGGKLYQVAEFAYAIYPQNSGNLAIPSLLWDVKIPQPGSRQSLLGFGGRYEISRLRTDALDIEVKAPPAAFPADAVWLPTRALSLDQSWSKATDNFKVGEPITRSITLRAEGLMAAQLPKIWEAEDSTRVKVYFDQPQQNDDKRGTGISGTRVESAAVVIAEAGSAQLPAIRLPWWNTRTESLEYAELPAQSLQVAGGAAPGEPEGSAATEAVGARATDATTANAQASEESAQLAALRSALGFWQGVSALLATVALGLGLVLLWRRQSRHSHNKTAPAEAEDEGKTFRALQQACLSGDTGRIREALLRWGKARWGRHIHTLDALAQAADTPPLSALLAELDRARYHPEGSPFDGGSLANVLNTLRREERDSAVDARLAGFYPGPARG